MLTSRYDPLTHAYMLLCGATHLIEEYDTEVFYELKKLPNRSAYHITNSLINTIVDAHHLLREAINGNVCSTDGDAAERTDSYV